MDSKIMLWNENRLDFHVDKGTNIIPLVEIRSFFQSLEYGSKYRIYFLLLFLSLRPGEPLELTWDNFLLKEGKLIFRPGKQKRRNVVRTILLPPSLIKELEYYKENNFFWRGKLFDIKQDSVRKYLNRELRPMLPPRWRAFSGNKRQGRCSEYFYYTQQSFRTTAATLVFYYYSEVYGSNNSLSLHYTCKFMGHSSEKITATYYVQRVSALGVENFPRNLSYFNLFDFVIYKEIQTKISNFAQIGQTSLFGYDAQLVL